eukprot:TRINITY_DN6318_c0_g1_i10.p1 TRINITY_DN6318_c0_g1~~TRINITY_DN6318_c0_g1_i10.p1  ORF type:complete len:290 (-),score=76.63 TRINITY_DN6318_c0_g1_i10:1963-2802(-)
MDATNDDIVDTQNENRELEQNEVEESAEQNLSEKKKKKSKNKKQKLENGSAMEVEQNDEGLVKTSEATTNDQQWLQGKETQDIEQTAGKEETEQKQPEKKKKKKSKQQLLNGDAMEIDQNGINTQDIDIGQGEKDVEESPQADMNGNQQNKKKNKKKKQKQDESGNEEQPQPTNETQDDEQTVQTNEDDNQELEVKPKKSTGNTAFRRVVDDVWLGKQGSFDNSYEGTFGKGGYGFKAQEKLGKVRGKDFRHEKTKKKKGTYRGGAIDFGVNSVKFDSN